MARDVDKKEAILAAALELFVEKGFYGTSVPSLAERAGVAAGTIYHYFESKEALVNHLYKHWKAEIALRVMGEFPLTKPPRERFRIIWERMAKFALQYPKELAFMELHHHASYLDEEARQMELTVLAFGLEMVRRAQAEHAIKRLDAEMLIELVNGAFLGIFRAGIEGRLPMTKGTFMEAERCCWEAVRAWG
jgi:AcrR family transcriptional regulator